MEQKTVWQCNVEGIIIDVIELSKQSGDYGKDGWLIPAGCVEKEPPDFKEGHYLKWTGDEWVQKMCQAPVKPPEVNQEELEALKKKEEQATIKAQYDNKKAEYLWLYQAAFLKGDLKTAEHWQQAYQKANEEFIHAMRALNGIKEEES